MRWGTVLVSLLALVVGAGCPHAFGKDGTVDRAVRKDSRERSSAREMEEACPSQEELDQLCEDPGEPICPSHCLPE